MADVPMAASMLPAIKQSVIMAIEQTGDICVFIDYPKSEKGIAFCKLDSEKHSWKDYCSSCEKKITNRQAARKFLFEVNEIILLNLLEEEEVEKKSA